MKRRIFVYKLLVDYPPGEPPRSAFGDPDPMVRPNWPRAHLYLTQKGAETRANMLRQMGCTVKIARSREVEFNV